MNAALTANDHHPTENVGGTLNEGRASEKGMGLASESGSNDPASYGKVREESKAQTGASRE